MNDTKLVVLISTSFATAKQVSEQSRAITILESLRIDFEVVDGSNKEEHKRRNELFSISGARGMYPQFFLADCQGENPIFIGDFDALEGINEASSLPEEILDANPTILTWNKLMNGATLCQ